MNKQKDKMLEDEGEDGDDDDEYTPNVHMH
jgi:hypothetical protein